MRYEVGSAVNWTFSLLLFLQMKLLFVCLFVFSQMVLSGSNVQEIKFEAFDKDLDSDDFLGRCVCVICSWLITDLHRVLHLRCRLGKTV